VTAELYRRETPRLMAIRIQRFKPWGRTRLTATADHVVDLFVVAACLDDLLLVVKLSRSTLFGAW